MAIDLDLRTSDPTGSEGSSPLLAGADAPAGERFSKFLLCLYASYDLDQLLANYLSSVPQLIRTPFPAVYLLDAESGCPIRVASLGTPGEFLRVYERSGRSVDPRLAYIRSRKEPVHEAQLFNEREWHSHRFASVRRVALMERIMEAPLLESGNVTGTLNFSRPPGEPSFTEEELLLAGRISQHLGSALAHAREFARLIEQERLVDAALQSLGTALLVTDARGRLEYANEAGRRLLERCRENHALGVMMAEALESNRRQLEGNAPQVLRTLRLPPRALAREPYLTMRSVRLIPGSALTATFVYLSGEDPNFQHLRGMLTEREIGVLELVAQGLEYKEIAECLMVGVETIKTHMKRIFFKMNVTSRTQLVSRALCECREAARGIP